MNVSTSAIALTLTLFLGFQQTSVAAERLPIAKPGDVITMTARNPDGPLCPNFGCSQRLYTTRIPTGTKLRVLQVRMLKQPIFDVPYYLVEYKGKKGWVSEYLTDRSPKGVGKDFCPRNPKGPFTGCDRH